MSNINRHESISLVFNLKFVRLRPVNLLYPLRNKLHGTLLKWQSKSPFPERKKVVHNEGTTDGQVARPARPGRQDYPRAMRALFALIGFLLCTSGKNLLTGSGDERFFAGEERGTVYGASDFYIFCNVFHRFLASQSITHAKCWFTRIRRSKTSYRRHRMNPNSSLTPPDAPTFPGTAASATCSPRRRRRLLRAEHAFLARFFVGRNGFRGDFLGEGCGAL